MTLSENRLYDLIRLYKILRCACQTNWWAGNAGRMYWPGALNTNQETREE